MLGRQIHSVTYRGVARNSFWVGIIFLVHDTTVLYTSSLTTSAAISAQNNYQGLILGGYVMYTDIPPVTTPLVTYTVVTTKSLSFLSNNMTRTRCSLVLMLYWWAHWEALRPAGWGETWITRMLAINVSILNLTVARLEQFPSPQMTDNKPSFTRKPHVVIFSQSPFAANAVPKLVAMATSLRPLISGMSSLDSLTPKTYP